MLAPPELKARTWKKVMVRYGQIEIPKWCPAVQQEPTVELQQGKFKAQTKGRGRKRQAFNPEAPVTRRVRQRYSHALDPTFSEGLPQEGTAAAAEAATAAKIQSAQQQTQQEQETQQSQETQSAPEIGVEQEPTPASASSLDDNSSDTASSAAATPLVNS